ncbi:MAG: hypothetical protein J7M18_08050 [Candidatus Eremiobacteraeota bacterium]|nr:hypothetical protein [Candidatus Eremiobacteraeota bacterium]
MNRKLIIILLVVSALVFSPGCLSLKGRLKKPVDENAVKFGKIYIDAIRTGDFDKIEKYIGPKVRRKFSRENILKIRKSLDYGEPVKISPVGYQDHTYTNFNFIHLFYEIQFKDKWIGAVITVEDTPLVKKLYDVKIFPMEKSFDEIDDFALGNKSPLHYLVLLLSIVIPLFIIYSLIACIRSNVGNKWWWILFIIFGIGKIVLNWATGAITFVPISLVLLGAGIIRPELFCPWYLFIGVPVGAIVFNLLKPGLERKKKEVEKEQRETCEKKDNRENDNIT